MTGLLRLGGDTVVFTPPVTPAVQLVPPAPGPGVVFVPSEGPPGPQGVAGGTYLLFHQDSASAAWVVPHLFGRVPQVQIFDDANEVMYPDIHPDVDSVSVIFAQPTTGFALLT